MWTISDEQMAAITESLVKVAEKITEKAINKGTDAVSNIDKSKSQEIASSATDERQVSTMPEPKDGFLSNISSSTSTKTPSSKSNNTDTTQTVNPVLPCEQVEVISISSYAPAELPRKEIIGARWLTEDEIEIKSSFTNRNVKIQVVTNGFINGEKLKIEILDSTNKTIKNIELILENNTATSELFEAKEEWLGKILFMNFKL